MMKPFYTFQSDTYKIRGLINMIGIKKRMIKIQNIQNLKLNKFSQSEISQINKFKISSRKKFFKFVKELQYLRTLK